MNELELLAKLWYGQSEASRIAVLDELRGLASAWQESSCDYETKQDAQTLVIVVNVLEHFERLKP